MEVEVKKINISTGGNKDENIKRQTHYHYEKRGDSKPNNNKGKAKHRAGKTRVN